LCFPLSRFRRTESERIKIDDEAESERIKILNNEEKKGRFGVGFRRLPLPVKRLTRLAPGEASPAEDPAPVAKVTPPPPPPALADATAAVRARNRPPPPLPATDPAARKWPPPALADPAPGARNRPPPPLPDSDDRKRMMEEAIQLERNFLRMKM
jgi:hypothetical protein